MTLTPECARRIARGGWVEDLALQRCTWPIGPRNTFSNLAYPLVGLGLLLLAPSPMTTVMAVALSILGVGSALYHGWKTPFTNALDWFGMYAVMLVLVLHGVAPHAPVNAAWFSLAFGLLFGGVFSFQKQRFDWHMGALFVLASLPLLLAKQWWPVTGVTWLFGAAKYVSQRRECGLWGHAYWHGLTGVAMGLLFVAQVRLR